MRKRLLATLSAISFLAFSPAVQAQPATSDRDDVLRVQQEDREMNEAIAKAQATLPEFLDVLDDPRPGVVNIAFKFPLGGWEHIWVGNVRWDGDSLTGVLNNRPMQDEWAEGDAVRVPLESVSDWAWMGPDGVMRGHYTTRVLLNRMSPEMAASIRQSFGWTR